MLFKNTEILCDKTVSQSHTMNQHGTSRLAEPCASKTCEVTNPRWALTLRHYCSLQIMFIFSLILQPEKEMLVQVPQEIPKLCAMALWSLPSMTTRAGYRRDMESGSAACPEAPD